jgi:4-amino-4-deoxy-L-arabinose transferase-like glycosyltransferase
MTEFPVRNLPSDGPGVHRGGRLRSIPAWGWALVAAAAARALLLPAFELVPQEAYYAFYAREPSLSYFDHPPLLAWALAAAFRLFGQRALAVRAVPFLLTLGTQLAFLPLARRFVGGGVGRAALLFCTTGVVTLLSLVALPDPPLVLTWTLALLALASALFEGKRWAWPLAGVFLGLAFDAKYTGAALWAGLFLFLVASPVHRRLLRTPGPWVALGVAQLVALPVYVWNAQHGWASFLFQSSGRAQTASGLGLRNVLALASTQAVLLLPPLAIALVLVAARGVRALSRRALEPEELFLAVFCLPVLLAGVLLSAVLVVKANWLLPAYVTGVLWVARRTGPRLLRWNLWCSAALHALFLLELLFYPVVLRTDDTWLGWRALAAEVGARVRPGEFVFSADDYKTTAELLFYSHLEVYGRNVLGERALQFDYAGLDPRLLLGRDALFIDSAPGDPTGEEAPGNPPPRLVQAFREVWPEPPVRVSFRGRPVRSFRVWRCFGYLGPPGR